MLSENLKKTVTQIQAQAKNSVTQKASIELAQQLEAESEKHACLRCTMATWLIVFDRKQKKLQWTVGACGKQVAFPPYGDALMGLIGPESPFWCSSEENDEVVENE